MEARVQTLEGQIAKNVQCVLDVLEQALRGTPYSALSFLLSWLSTDFRSMKRRWLILLGAVLLLCSFGYLTFTRLFDAIDFSGCQDAVQQVQVAPPSDVSLIAGFQKLRSLPKISILNASKVNQLEQTGRGFIRDAFWSDNGRLLVLTSIGLWQHQQFGSTLSEPQLLQGLSLGNYEFIRSLDNALLAITNNYSSDSVRIIEIGTGKTLASIKLNGMIWNAGTFSPDGTKLAGDVGDHVNVWDAHNGSLITTLGTFRNGIYHVAFSPDSKLIAVSGDVVRVWSLQDKTLHLEVDADGSQSLAFNSDGTQLLVRGHNGLSTWPVGSSVTDSSATPTPTFPSINFATLKPYYSQGVTSNLSFDTADNLRGQLAASLSSSFSSLPVLTPDQTAVLYIALAGSADSRVVRECDLSTGKEHRTLYYHADTLAFSPDKSMLAINDGYGRVYLLDAQTYQEMAILVANGGNEFTQSSNVVFSPDSAVLAFAAKNADTGAFDIQLWDVKARKRLGVLQGHTALTISLVFNANGSLLASSSLDGTVRLWGTSEQK